MKTDVLIVGGGLAGLSLAWQLEQQGRHYHIIEARNRLGGRVHAYQVVSNEQLEPFDCGPSWFWPGQPRIAKLIHQLGLKSFKQYAEGDVAYEDEQGRVQYGVGYASMQGSYRLEGSWVQLIAALADKIPSACLSLTCQAIAMEAGESSIMTRISMQGDKEQIIESQQVVLAIPPRIAAEIIGYSPSLGATVLDAMKQIPTWMAGHAKVIALYDRPFWREAGFSGDVMSRRGPLVEIHDASPSDRSPSSDLSLYALFGFVGVPAVARKNQSTAIIEAALTQLVNVFGEQAQSPVDIVLQDWAFEYETATALDHKPLSQHPTYGLPKVLDGLWKGRLLLGSTEVANEFGGYLEGALEASESVMRQLQP